MGFQLPTSTGGFLVTINSMEMTGFPTDSFYGKKTVPQNLGLEAIFPENSQCLEKWVILGGTSGQISSRPKTGPIFPQKVAFWTGNPRRFQGNLGW